MPGIVYRKALPLPDASKDYVSACIEERLYGLALEVLRAALVAGTGTPRAAYVPGCHIVALVATLAVHPRMTTRTHDEAYKSAADKALQYLRLLHDHLGPRLSGLKAAFYFESSRSVRASRRRSTDSIEVGVESEKVQSRYADEDSLWSGQRDFWNVLGWSFNCSIRHKARWKRWRQLLAIMLDTLEADLDQYLTECKESDVSPEDDPGKTLLMNFLGEPQECRGYRRRYMAAILADGSERSIAEFGEIWENEAAPPKQKKAEQAKKQLDISKDQYGGYDIDSDASADDRPTKSKYVPRLKIEQQKACYDDDDWTASQVDLGGLDSILLRKRMLSLLTHFSIEVPNAFLDNESLNELYTDAFRGLPLSLFRQLVFDLSSDRQSQAMLDAMLLRALIDSSAPTFNDCDVTQAHFEKHFAPFAAKVVGPIENARLGLLVEDSLKLLWKAGMLKVSKELRIAVQAGIDARKQKAIHDGRKRTPQEEEAISILEASGKRMLMILDMTQT